MIMKFSFNWLKELVEIKKSPQEIAEMLTMHFTEVDAIEELGKNLENVVVGKVLDILPHPNADKLKIPIVDIGNKRFKIVCGAPNLESGKLVAVALPGARLAGGVEIKKAEIRGVESSGMICTEDELGLGSDHSGIMILPDNLNVGENLAKALGLDDIIFDISILPNRPDAFSHLGLAREIAAITRERVKSTEFRLEEGEEKTEKFISVEIKNPELCPRYIARYLRGVKIGPAPDFIQKRLSACGMRPINNVVDITNYVMLLFGQPLHAFDASKISGKGIKKIIVRKARDGEKIKTLDNEERNLFSDVLVIADSSGPIAIAGVMGGAETEIDERTTDVILESASFSGPAIRRGASKLGLRSEAVMRFEKNLDENLTVIASEYAAYLMTKYASGEILRGAIDVYPRPKKPKAVILEIPRLQKILGIDIKIGEASQILSALEFEVKKISNDILEVGVPSFRDHDVTREEDLIEEVARIYGYEKFSKNLPYGVMRPSEKNPDLELEARTKNIFTGLGFWEVYNKSFLGKELIEKVGLRPDDHIRVANPLSLEHEFMRTSLVPLLLENSVLNLKNRSEIKLFELGRIFEKEVKKENWVKGISEGIRLSAILTKAEGDLIYPEAKEMLDCFLRQIDFIDWWYDPLYLDSKTIFWHKGRTAVLKTGEKKIGVIGEVHPEILTKFDINQRVAVIDLNFKKILDHIKREKKIKPFSRFQQSEFDLAFVVDRLTLVGDLEKALRAGIDPLVKNFKVFDIYEGAPLPEGKKNIAIRFELGALDRNLNDKEIEEVKSKIIDLIEKKFRAKLRA